MWLLNTDKEKTIKVQVAEGYIHELLKSGVVPFKPITLEPRTAAHIPVKFEFCQFDVSGDGKAEAQVAVDVATLNQYLEKYKCKLID